MVATLPQCISPFLDSHERSAKNERQKSSMKIKGALKETLIILFLLAVLFQMSTIFLLFDSLVGVPYFNQKTLTYAWSLLSP